MSNLSRVNWKEYDKSLARQIEYKYMELKEAEMLGKDTVILKADLKEIYTKWQQLSE